MSESGSPDLRLAARRYARGELAGEELDRFEDHLMEHPELLDEIEAEDALGEALHGNVVPLRPRAAAAPRARAGFQPWLAAACLLVAIGAGYFTAGFQGQAPGAVISGELRLEPVRSGSAGEMPSIASGEGHTLFVLDVGLQPAGIERLVITRGDGSEVMQLADPSVIDGYLQFAVAGLDPGTYRVEVYPAAGDAASKVYAFAVRGS